MEVRARPRGFPAGLVLKDTASHMSPVVFRRSRSLKDERPRVKAQDKGDSVRQQEDQIKLFFLIDDTP